MSKYPPNDYDEPYIGDPLPMGEAHAISDNATLVERLLWSPFGVGAASPLKSEAATRITELEAEIARLTAELATMEEAALRNGVALQRETRAAEREACELLALRIRDQVKELVGWTAADAIAVAIRARPAP